MPTPVLAHALRALAWCAGLPGRRLRRHLAHWMARRETARRSTRARIVACNLRLAGLDAALAPEVLRNTALTFLEGLRFWTRPRAGNLREVVAVEGLEHLEAAEAAGAVLVVAPHYGNWELLVQWLAQRRGFALLYTRGDSPAMDGFLKLARERHGVRAVAADAHGMKPLLKMLHAGGTVGITPDQVPDGGRGEWAPFFGVPALTMTLIHRLVAGSGATPLLAAAERRADGCFTVRIAPLPEGMTTGTLQAGVETMNLAVEAFVRRDPAQYQWTYKRFKGQRPGEDLVNPYWPECYR
jgi:KDO2-lipid IV(A) lauroyltransferase